VYKGAAKRDYVPLSDRSAGSASKEVILGLASTESRRRDALESAGSQETVGESHK